MPALSQLWTLVRNIPPGRCTSYGALGQALDNPVSGFLVGRWMAQCPSDVPWWRVVAKDGRLPIYKRDPYAADDQQTRLEAEGVPFKDGAVDMAAVWWDPR
jgi:methylated-DNA-protein-cysteine methyltransferase related protein